ncbi:hypothetical protein AMTRI_Chr08g164740 [Amborella trichopoda]
MALRKDNTISKCKGKVFKRVDNGREEESSPLFPRVRYIPEGMPSHISQGLRSSEVPRRVNDFPVIVPWFRDWFLSARQWPELMDFLASVSMIGILNMTSCHVNFLLLEALTERFNHQTNTFFLPTGETTPTLEEVVKVSGLSLARIAYQPSPATDDHSITGVFLSCFFPWISYFYHRKSSEKAWTKSGGFDLSDTAGVTRETLLIWAYEHIVVVCPPRSTKVVSAALGLAYANDTTRPRDINHYRRILDELSSFDWVIRGLENVPLFRPGMGCSCLILAGQFFTEGYFPQSVLRQFHHIQHYTSPGEAIDRRPIFPLRWHSSNLLVKEAWSWKGKKPSSREGLIKQDKPTTTSNYDSWWERTCPLPLCPRSSRLHGEPSAPAQDFMLSQEDGATCSNKRIKSNDDVSDISLEEAEVELA